MIKYLKSIYCRNNSSEKGFTLIELLIVVAIIGILAAIAIPQFAKYRQRAFHTTAKADIRNVKVTIEAVYTETQEFPAGI